MASLKKKMKKDSCPKPPEHPHLTEEKNLKETISLGKSGGMFDLPLGGVLMVPEGVFSKKDVVTCTVIPPSRRWRHTPSFPGEHLTSEIFALSGSVSFKQRRRSSRRSTSRKPYEEPSLDTSATASELPTPDISTKLSEMVAKESSENETSDDSVACAPDVSTTVDDNQTESDVLNVENQSCNNPVLDTSSNRNPSEAQMPEDSGGGRNASESMATEDPPDSRKSNQVKSEPASRKNSDGQMSEPASREVSMTLTSDPAPRKTSESVYDRSSSPISRKKTWPGQEGAFSPQGSRKTSEQPWLHPGTSGGEKGSGEMSITFSSKSITLLLPYNPPESKHVELNVKGMWKDECTWVDVGFIPREDSTPPCLEVTMDRLGTFAVTFRSKTDQFQVTPNGGLFHSRLNRNLTVRLPKKAVDTCINYTMKIEPISEERVAFCREYFPHDCADLLVASEFIDLDPDTKCDFRRNATVKLPLPQGVEVEGESSEEIVILHKEGGSWQWVESKYKFARNNVTFDVKNPSRFCVVKSKPDRHRKMQGSVAILEEHMEREKGQMCVFLSLLEKSWMGLVEVFPLAIAPAKIASREEQGFIVVYKKEVNLDVTPKSSFSRRPPPAQAFKPRQLDCLEMFDDLTWTVDLEEDLLFDAETDLSENAQLKWFRYLKESYRRFKIVPATEEERALKGVFTLRPEGILDPKFKERLTLSFSLDISEDTVKKYYYVPPPEPEPEPVRPKSKIDIESLLNGVGQKKEESPTLKPVTARQRTFSVTTLDRLSQPSRRASIPDGEPDKEAKVISGKSLMTLSKVVNEGLTLAVHLDLPDSTITGIGFDALSNNRSMSEVGYRILLYWKRTRKDKRDGAVSHLLRALRTMGKHGVADVIEERHKENKELTMECFLMAAVSGVNIHG